MKIVEDTPEFRRKVNRRHAVEKIKKAQLKTIRRIERKKK